MRCCPITKWQILCSTISEGIKSLGCILVFGDQYANYKTRLEFNYLFEYFLSNKENMSKYFLSNKENKKNESLASFLLTYLLII